MKEFRRRVRLLLFRGLVSNPIATPGGGGGVTSTDGQPLGILLAITMAAGGGGGGAGVGTEGTPVGFLLLLTKAS